MPLATCVHVLGDAWDTCVRGASANNHHNHHNNSHTRYTCVRGASANNHHNHHNNSHTRYALYLTINHWASAGQWHGFGCAYSKQL